MLRCPALGKWETSRTEIVVALKVLVEVWANNVASECFVLKPLPFETGFRKLYAFISLESSVGSESFELCCLSVIQ